MATKKQAAGLKIKLIKKFDELKIPYIIVVNKIDEKPLSDAILADLQKYTKNSIKQISNP